MTDRTNTAQPAAEDTPPAPPAGEDTQPASPAGEDTQPASPAGEDTQPASPAGPGEFSAAAPPDPRAAGTGETSFADAEAPPAGGPRTEEAAPADARAADGGTEAAKYLELAKRTQADFENYRKRMARENAQASERGAGRLAKELLPALDHLDLALRAADAEPSASAGAADQADVVKGFAMVRDELIAALGRCGIEPFSPQGEPFDPSQHEAMAQAPAEDAESGTVVEVYQQGYRLNGAVLRPARVVVAQ